jgi:hypothetical protein
MSEKRIFIGNLTKLTYGKEYTIVDFRHGKINVIDDYGDRIICLDRYFVKLDEWRLTQLDKYLYEFEKSNLSK